MEFLKKPIYKCKKNRKIDGVCAGIAKTIGVDVSWIRLLFVISIFAGGSGIIVYILLDIVLDNEPEDPLNSDL